MVQLVKLHFLMPIEHELELGFLTVRHVHFQFLPLEREDIFSVTKLILHLLLITTHLSLYGGAENISIYVPPDGTA